MREIVGLSPDRVDLKSKTIKLVFFSFSAKHTALRRKSKGWLARNQNNVSKLGDMSICAGSVVSVN
jgi:hypothetical protein